MWSILLQFCCKFTIVSVCQNYENIMRFDKVIAKIIRVHFLPHDVVSGLHTLTTSSPAGGVQGQFIDL